MAGLYRDAVVFVGAIVCRESAKLICSVALRGITIATTFPPRDYCTSSLGSCRVPPKHTPGSREVLLRFYYIQTTSVDQNYYGLIAPFDQ
jgi:hypothetical protein